MTYLNYRMPVRSRCCVMFDYNRSLVSIQLRLLYSTAVSTLQLRLKSAVHIPFSGSLPGFVWSPTSLPLVSTVVLVNGVSQFYFFLG